MGEIKVHHLSESFFHPYFSKEKEYKRYEILGAKEIEYKGERGINFCVWAPNAKKINLVGDFNHWDGKNYSMKKIENLGVWNIFISGLQEGIIYKYEIYTKDNSILLKSDPYAYYSELRPNNASIVISLEEYEWKDENWLENNKKESKFEKSMSIYEMHLGSWKRKENGDFYNYREIANEIIPYVKEMGYTHIELLPVTEYPFDGSWGYQVTGYFSITSRYGKPTDFMYFIDKCHEEKIGVILDWVPGHFCKDEHGLYQFDGRSLYEHDDPLMAENVEWGTGIFDYEKKEVMNFLISSAVFWFDVYHIDGLRVDAVSYMIYLDAGKKEWIPNAYGGRENIFAIQFLKKLNHIIHTYFPSAIMIAEESTAWPFVTGSSEIGGLGFDFKWNMGWMNDTLKYMEMDPIYRKWHHNLITFSFTYAFSENYILPLSHDEVVHGKKSLIEKMCGDYWRKFASLRLLYAYMFAHPGKKLLFMGDEFAQFIEWNYDKALDWLLLEYENHKKIKDFVKVLNLFYKKEKALYEIENHPSGFEWIDHQNYEESIIAFMRKGKKKEDFIIIICNFTPVPRYDYKIGVPSLGEYEEVMNTDASEYGGSGVLNKEKIYAQNVKWNNQKYHITITVPPLGASFIKWRRWSHGEKK